MVYRPGISPLELVTPDTIKKLGYFFTTVKREVVKEFKNPKLAQILQFPVLFLGAKPSNTPAFYNFMNYADFGLGTWHPKEGMYSIVKGMVALAESLGVKIELNSPIDSILVKNKKTFGVKIKGKEILSDVVLSGADYHHTETLLEPEHRAYSEAYWSKKVFGSIFIIVSLLVWIKRLKTYPITLYFLMWILMYMPKVFMMIQNGQKNLCFMLISLPKVMLQWHQKEKKVVFYWFPLLQD